MTPIVSRFPGRCSKCGTGFGVGAAILWERGSKPTCVACPPASPVLPPAAAAAVIAQAAAPVISRASRLTPPVPVPPVAPVPAPAAAAAPGYTPAPPFAQVDGETRDQLGHRALLFALAHGVLSFWRLPIDALDACIHALRTAICRLPGKDGGAMAETLGALLSQLRAEEAYRAERRDAILAALQAQADAMDAGQGGGQGVADNVAPAAPQAPANGNGGGGSKVPRVPKPKGNPPAAGANRPVLTALPKPAPVVMPAPVPVPAAAAAPAAAFRMPVSTLADADLF